MRFLSIGECMGELTPVETPGHFRFGFAGDTFNTAWYLRQLRPDTEIEYCTAVGDDEISAQMLEGFAGHGIGTRFVTRRADRSIGLYMITLKDGERHFTYWRSASAARRLAEDAAALELALGWAETVYLSGITMAILEEGGRDRLLDAVTAAKARGVRVVFDTNIRPRLWASPDEMKTVITRTAALADLTLPSFDDEAGAFGDADPSATAARYAVAGSGAVIVKNGAGPVWVRAPEIDEACPVEPATQVVDTTAAGDSFNAAIIDALDRGLGFGASVAQAAAVSRQVIAARGALVTLDTASQTSPSGPKAAAHPATVAPS